MDIEGSEYEVLSATPRSTLERFRIVLVEFHDFRNRLAGAQLFDSTNRLFERLLSIFAVAHVHGNNAQRAQWLDGIWVPPLIEVTLIRRDRLSGTGSLVMTPHKLDSRNNPNRREVRLPRHFRTTR